MRRQLLSSSRTRFCGLVLGMFLITAGVGGGRLWLATGPVAAAAAQETASGEMKTLYTCGMHPEIISDEPGRCPKCDMKLTPMDKDRAAMILQARGEKVPEGAGKPKDRKILYWRAPMDPSYIRQEPGKSPMGMDLVPVYEDDVAGGPTIRIDPVTEQNMGVRYDVVRTGPLEKTVRTVGTVDYDEQSLSTVTTKVEGWVEKLYVQETGTQVHAGDPLFELYSRDLFTAQEEYLIALRDLERARGEGQTRVAELTRARVASASQRLALFDISQEQIKKIEESGELRKTLTITAGMTGIVTHRNVTRGDFLKAGQPAYRIADLSNVWVIGKVYESDVPFIKLGQEALMRLDYLPGRTYRGRVTYIYPYLEKGTREIPVRMEFHNPGYELKPGMYATLEIASRIAEWAVLAPSMAVIDTGERQVVFVQREAGKFEPRRIRIGMRNGLDELQVLSGLAPGEMVVVSGQFLLDSESRLREATLKMLGAGAINTSDFMEPATAEAEPGHLAGGEARWVCPMPAHSGILYDDAGKCPLCGMKLVPTNPWNQAGEEIDHYTCPMPEHYSVHEEGPGKCPLCGMTRIPVTRAEMKRFASVAASEKPPALYTCPMPAHAEVVQTTPGKCPACGMKLVPVEAVPHGQHAAAQWKAEHRAAQPAAATPGLELYTCPMESHAHIVSDQPGHCPECNMKLVPVAEVDFAAKAAEAWQAMHPAAATAQSASGPITLYTCPMHSHASVVSEQPGKCPLCNMQLVPLAEVEFGAEAEAAWRLEHPLSATAEIRPATPRQ